MSKACGTFTILVMTIVLLSWFQIPDIAAQQAAPPLSIEIIVSQAEIAMGAPITWRIRVAPRSEAIIGSLELKSGDARTWAWTGGPQKVGTLAGTVALKVSAVPLVDGDLYPIVEAHYTFEGEMQTMLISEENPIRVKSIEDFVEAKIVTEQGSVNKGDRVTIELWIVNDSPFKLTNLEWYASGKDLTWDKRQSPLEIPPHQTHTGILYAEINGERPRPHLNIRYVWTDAAGQSHEDNLSVSGEFLTLSKFTINEPWRTILGVLGGVITGSLVTLIPATIRGIVSRRRQKEVNRSHITGLLQMMILESEQAADNGVHVSTEPLQTIFRTHGLFAVAQRMGFAQNIRDLWKAAERHTKRLNQPDGAQRSEELREKARTLRRKLERIEKEQ